MRDEKDPGTLELLPAKRGRPCKFSDMGPMTPAQRARIYRERRRSRAGMAQADAGKKDPGFNNLYTYTDVQLLEAVRFALEAIRENPTNQRKLKAGRLIAELSRRYPHPRSEPGV